MDLRQGVCGLLQRGEVVSNIPKTKADGIPRKLFEIGKRVSANNKRTFLRTLINVRQLYSRKKVFKDEIGEYFKELSQQPEDSPERILGEELLKEVKQEESVEK